MDNLKNEYKNYLNKILSSEGLYKLHLIIEELIKGEISHDNYTLYIEGIYQDECSVYEIVEGEVHIDTLKNLEHTYTTNYHVGDYILKTYYGRNDILSYRNIDNIKENVKMIADKYLKEDNKKYYIGEIEIDILDPFSINGKMSGLEKHPKKFKNILNNETTRNTFIQYIDALRAGTINY